MAFSKNHIRVDTMCKILKICEKVDTKEMQVKFQKNINGVIDTKLNVIAKAGVKK